MTQVRSGRGLRRVAGCAAAGAALVALGPPGGAALAQSAAVVAPAYRYVDLGVLGTGVAGDRFSSAADIAAGHVVGESTYPGGAGRVHAFSRRNGRLTDLGDGLPGGGGASGATAVNRTGVVAGQSDVIGPYVHPHAVLWRDGMLTDLGTGYPAGSGSYARGINDVGQVVGTHYRSSKGIFRFQFRAALFSGGTVRDLGTLGGTDTSPYAVLSEAYAINRAGQVVGTALPVGGAPTHGFVWQNGVMRDLGTLGGNGEATIATGINEKGTIVGFSQTASGETHAFLWRAGRMRDLGVLGPDFTYRGSYAADVNGAGTVVGSTRVRGGAYGTSVAFVWRNGVMADLNRLVALPLGRRLRSAAAVDDDGTIVATSCEIGACDSGGGTDRAVVLVPR